MSLVSKQAICHRHPQTVVLTFIGLLSGLNGYAQAADGNNGINQANTMIRSYFETGTQLLLGIGAILGLVGAIRVYQLWNTAREEATKAATAWFGACIFLVVVSTVLKSFFGL